MELERIVLMENHEGPVLPNWPQGVGKPQLTDPKDRCGAMIKNGTQHWQMRRPGSGGWWSRSNPESAWGSRLLCRRFWCSPVWPDRNRKNGKYVRNHSEEFECVVVEAERRVLPAGASGSPVLSVHSAVCGISCVPFLWAEREEIIFLIKYLCIISTWLNDTHFAV